jgi:hypothetical protein
LLIIEQKDYIDLLRPALKMAAFGCWPSRAFKYKYFVKKLAHFAKRDILKG